MNLCCFRDSAETFLFWNSNLHNGSRKKTCLAFWLVTKSRYLHCEANKIAFFFSENNQSQHPDTGLEQPELWRGLGGGVFFINEISNLVFVAVWKHVMKISWMNSFFLGMSSTTEILILPFSPHGGQVIWTRFQDELREFPAVTVNESATTNPN